MINLLQRVTGIILQIIWQTELRNNYEIHGFVEFQGLYKKEEIKLLKRVAEILLNLLLSLQVNLPKQF